MFFSGCFVYSQNVIIQGIVKNSNNNLLNNVGVYVQDKNSDKIFAGTYSNKIGFYKLEINSDILRKNPVLKFSLINHTIKLIDLSQTDLKSTGNNEINISLDENIKQIDEVIITKQNPIETKKDTVTFNVKYFKKGNEQVVEDLLKNLPGINIDADGKIKVGNKLIDKVLVEGDDFFDKSYQIVTKNMPSHPVEKVQVIDKFSENKLLKGIENSDKTVINIVLNKDAKSKWFGNVNGGINANLDKFYDVSGNLLKFTKDDKYYIIANLNNTGYNSLSDINHVIRPDDEDESGFIGDDQKITETFSTLQPWDILNGRTNYIKSYFASFNSIHNLTKKTKLKTLIFLNNNDNESSRSTISTYNLKNDSFSNQENYSLFNRTNTIYTKLDLVSNFSEKESLNFSTAFNFSDFNSNSNLVFNSIQNKEKLNSTTNRIDQKINYTNKLKENKAFIVNVRYFYENQPQEYNTNQFFFYDIFSGFDPNTYGRQNVRNNLSFLGVEGKILNKYKDNMLLEVSLGNLYRKDGFKSNLNLFDTQKKDEVAFNNTSYINNNVFLKANFSFDYKKFSFVSSLTFNQYINSINNKNVTEHQTPFFLSPVVNFKWQVNEKNKIFTNFSINNTLSKISELYTDYVLADYRTLITTRGDFRKMRNTSATLNYQYGKWSDRFLLNAFLMYTEDNNYITTNSRIQPDYIINQLIYAKDRKFFNSSLTTDYFIKKIKSNIKLKVSASDIQYSNIINNNNRDINSKNYSLGVETKSVFRSFFNYNLGYTLLMNNMIYSDNNVKNKVSNNILFGDLNFTFKKFNFKTKIERYSYENYEPSYFFDAEANFNIKDDKFVLTITGKNLFNARYFTSQYLTDTSSSVTQYNLLSRFLILKLRYRF
ncbi:hypothetical protein RM51_02530 [Chryseobacterium taiwanense]|uniref:TonB-dependent receptor n=1 Tax=Chryseobacterium taiwanense TaxID=363331 RepID=A0A0B4DK81_9FLAO|nr:hypothetical protein RM51_02530 [Chryseobacterium taiwanense]